MGKKMANTNFTHIPNKKETQKHEIAQKLVIICIIYATPSPPP